MQLQSPIKETISWDEIRYSQVWEDSFRLRKALQILPTDHVLCIGSAGCNALELLLDNPRKISVIDLSPAQNALVDLRFQALKHLDYEQYMSLLGLHREFNANSLYRSLRHRVLPMTRSYFDYQEKLLNQGLLHQGRLEKYFQLFRQNALQKIWSPAFMVELLSCQNLESQTALLQTQGQLEQLEKIVVQYFNREGLERAGDPGQMKYVTENSLGQVLFRRFLETIKRQLVSGNPYLYYFLTGHIAPENTRIPSLQKENFRILQERIQNVEIYLIDLETFLSQCQNESIQKMNLSDIFEYLSPAHCHMAFELISQKLSPQGKIAYWSFLVDRNPDHPDLIRIPNREIDRVWFYKDFSVYQKP